MSTHVPANVIDLNSVREQRETEAWECYAAAKARADETLLVEDGLAAGRAWRAFIDLLMSSDQRETLRACDRVVSIRPRR